MAKHARVRPSWKKNTRRRDKHIARQTAGRQEKDRQKKGPLFSRLAEAANLGSQRIGDCW